MTPSHRLLIALTIAATTAAPFREMNAAEAFELGEANFAAERPGGKEADSIVGDFVIRNDRISAVISGNLPLRRANMSTFYGEDGITPGCLYDLTLSDRANDQITIFAPLAQRGAINFVRIVKDGADGEAVIETYVSAAKAGGLARRHEYRLKDGWPGLLIVSTLTNEGKEPKKVALADGWTQMRSKGTVNGVNWADAIDPADKCGYAYAWVAEGGTEVPKGGEATIAPGATLTVARFLAVATSPAEAVGLVEARRNAEGTGMLTVTLKDQASGQPVTDGRVVLGTAPNQTAPAYPDEQGRIALTLPVGTYLMSVEDIG
ncbi:MAG: hypothetical protein KDM64_10260, partial [Verrucomicrobiae bacterium]|nr:hypothetical protein [Verrucomicrobiae bacterium]